MKRQLSGFGLIEIMVAMVIGLIVSLGIVQVFIASKGTYQTQSTSARMQEDARFILSKLIQEIRMTNMYGCLLIDSTPVPPSIVKPAALDDPILWNRATNTLTLITADVGNSGTTPTWTVVSNCRTSSRIYPGLRAPQAGETAFPLRRIVYTLRGTDLQMAVGLDGASTPQPVLSNIKSFAVSFGVTGSPMSYVNALASNAEALNIRSVRLSLVLSDPSGKVGDQAYNVVAALRNRF